MGQARYNNDSLLCNYEVIPMNSNLLAAVERLKNAIEESHLSYVDLEKATGIAKSSIQRYASGTTKKIPIDAIQKIADALGISAAWLMGLEDQSDPYPTYPTPTVTENFVTFPVIGEIAAGYDNIALESWDGDTVDIPASYLKGRSQEDFIVLRVTGDSMYPTYEDGDKVLILKQSTLNYSGQVGAVLYDDEVTTLKRVEYVMGEDWMNLVPINPQIPKIRIEGERLEHCRILGIPKLLIRPING